MGIVPESIQRLLQQISLHHPAVEREQFIELPFLVGVQMNPAGQQQPVLALDQLARCATLAEEFRAPNLGHRFVGMLHDVELVVDQATLRNPLLQAQTIGLMHVHTSGPNRTPLKRAELLLEELIQRFLLPFPPEPQRLSCFQIAYHREKLLFLPQIDFIHPHLPQRWLPSSLCPALQIAQIDGSDRAAGQSKLSRHTSPRRTLTRQPHRLFEALAERRLTRQLRYFLRLDSAVRTAHPIELDYNRRPVLRPRQIAHLALVNLCHLADSPTTAGTLQFAVPAFTTHPQPQPLGFFLDLAAIHPVPRTSQNLCPFVLAHPSQRTEIFPIRKAPSIDHLFRFLHRPEKSESRPNQTLRPSQPRFLSRL